MHQAKQADHKPLGVKLSLLPCKKWSQACMLNIKRITTCHDAIFKEDSEPPNIIAKSRGWRGALLCSHNKNAKD